MAFLRSAQKLIDGTYVSKAAIQATYDFGPVSATGHLVITADTAGVTGNYIRFIFADDGATNTGVVTSVTGTGTSIDPYIATISFKNGTATVKNLADLINADGTLGPLVTATYATTGAAHAATATVTPLAGGRAADANLGATDAVVIGKGVNVSLFVKTSGAATFVVEAANPSGPQPAGNVVPPSDGTAETDWYDYTADMPLEYDSDHGVSTPLVFSGAGSVCIELSPFTPAYLRLRRSDTNQTDLTVSAYVTAAG